MLSGLFPRLVPITRGEISTPLTPSHSSCMNGSSVSFHSDLIRNSEDRVTTFEKSYMIDELLICEEFCVCVGGDGGRVGSVSVRKVSR